MKKCELLMGILLLAAVLALSGKAAEKVNSQAVVSEVILIDPGHGGIDPGMIGIGKLQEKEVNLAISLKLKSCLEQEGFQVVMTRETDEGLYDEKTRNKKVQDLQRRCEMIEKYQPLVTVSIHQNSYEDETVYGPQVFYYADSENGKNLATAIQEEMNRQLEIENPREIKGNKTYYLLKKSKGVLNIVECGFLTNPNEAQNLTQEEYQEKIANSICAGIIKYKDELY